MARTPADLGPKGLALWRAMTRAFDFETAELIILEAAARQADDIAQLEELLSGRLIVAGSNGQPRLAAAVTEVRQGRLAMAKLLDQLRLPDETEVARSGAGVRAQRAANARWSRLHAVDGGDHGA